MSSQRRSLTPVLPARRTLTKVALPFTLVAGLSACLEEEEDVLDSDPALEEDTELRSTTHREKFQTQDDGTVTLSTGQVLFMVSENSDDDDNDGTDDNLSWLEPGENNIRAFEFSPPKGATHVYVGEPYIIADGSSAVGRAVEGWDCAVDGQGRVITAADFFFNELHPLPLTFYLEGTKVTTENEFGFEWQYYDNKDPMPDGGFAVGTVVDVDAQIHTGKKFHEYDKHLVDSDFGLSATVTPDISQKHKWGADPNTDLDVIWPTKKETKARLRDIIQHTCVIDGELRFDYSAHGHSIRASHRVIPTGPVQLEAPQGCQSFCGSIDERATWNDVHTWGPYELHYYYEPPLGLHKYYRVLDQCGEPITDSEYGGEKPHLVFTPDPGEHFQVQGVRDHVEQYRDPVDISNGSFTFDFQWLGVPSYRFMDDPPAGQTGATFQFPFAPGAVVRLMKGNVTFHMFATEPYDQSNPINSGRPSPWVGGSYEYDVLAARDSGDPNVYRWYTFWRGSP